MQIEHMREFVYISNHSSISSASSKLFVSSSTLSRHLLQMETELGVRLVTRSTNHFELTPAGERFLEYAIRISELYDSCKDDLGPYRLTSRIEITVGANFRTPSILRAIDECGILLQDQTPVVDIKKYRLPEVGSFFDHKIENPLDAVLDESIDVAVLFVGSSTDLRGLNVTELHAEPLVVFVAFDSPFANQESLTLADLKDETFIIGPQHFSFVDCIRDACNAAGFEPRTQIRSSRDMSRAFCRKSSRDVIVLPESSSVLVPKRALSGFHLMPNIAPIGSGRIVALANPSVTEEKDAAISSFVAALKLSFENHNGPKSPAFAV